MQTGVRLLEAKDYLGALAIFKDAYARFPSAKILLNIGTTLNLLARKADAANAYQRYLDSPDADPEKQRDVTTVVADLDRAAGLLEITVTPPDAEVQVNDGEWAAATSFKRYRVEAGPFTVRARKPKFGAEAKSAHITVGERAAVTIAMTALPEPEPVRLSSRGLTDDGVHGGIEQVGPRSRVGGYLMAHLDLPRGGGAALAGVTVDLVNQLTIQGAAILGPTYGGYVGASYAFLSGKVHPTGAVGIPVFFSNGARVGLRAAGGAELEITPHVSLLAELGLELMLNPEDDIRKVVFIPAVGAVGRL